MSTQQVQVMVPPEVRAPRGVDWVVRIAVHLIRVFGRLQRQAGRTTA